MIKTLFARIQQGYRTIPFPAKQDSLPQRYMGRPRIISSECPDDYLRCKEICPVGAINFEEKHFSLDIGKCLFCGQCQKACLKQTISFTRDYRMASCRRQELIINASSLSGESFCGAAGEKIKKLFGRSLKLRQVSAGGCNACELDTNVLNTIVFDLGRYGIQFVASPRHADGILVTGPVTENMRLALEKTYQAVPSPKIVIAVGACAISGGPYIGHTQAHNGVDTLLPVDLYVPGCPPHPLTILDGLLNLLGRL